MLFSQRYFRAIENNMLVVDIAHAARRKLWAWLSANNASLGIRRDPNDSWISNSSILEETERELLIEHGWEHLPVSPHSTNTEYHAALHLLVLDGPGPFVFDTIEIAASNMDSGERPHFADFGLSFQSQYSNAVPSSYMLYQNRQISGTGTIIARERKNGSGYHAQVTIKRSGKIVRQRFLVM